MTFEKDEFGLYLDSTIRSRVKAMCSLALEWYEYGSTNRQKEIVGEYHEIISQLYALGWNDEIHVHCQLPEEYMPETYKNQNPELFA